MKLYLLTLCLAFSSFSLIGQQKLSPVKWSFEIEKINDTDYELTATGTIEDNWCIYSPYTGENGPVPTSIDYSQGVKPIGDIIEDCKVKKGHDALFDTEVAKIEHKAVLKQKIRASSNTQQITAKLRYMSCDKDRCLPPTIVEYTHKL